MENKKAEPLTIEEKMVGWSMVGAIIVIAVLTIVSMFN